MSLGKFQCAACQAPLIGSVDDIIRCEWCDTRVPVVDGILQFAAGEIESFRDRTDERPLALDYRSIKTLAAGCWPGMLGSVLEIGCRDSLLTRGLIEGNEATDIVVTDISLPHLQTMRDDLERDGLLSVLPLIFATHGGTESVFRDGVFDTCAGTSALRGMTDVGGFLANVFRWLKPGGRAFFIEPNLRYYRALGQTLADIMALMQREDPGFSDGRTSLLHVIGQWRRGILRQSDPPFLPTLEDQHMFAGDTFEAMGRAVGFARTAAIPVAFSPTGAGFVGRLCVQIGVKDHERSAILGLLPAFADRYMSLLSPKDQTGSFLFWLEKGVGPVSRYFQGPPAADPAPPDGLPEAFLAGGLPPRWWLELTPSRSADGIALHVRGWCLVNTDVRWLRVTLGGVGREAAVWLPRSDVPLAVDPQGAYASWNALCCGVDARLSYPDATLDLRIEIALAGGGVLIVPVPDGPVFDETLVVSR